MTTQGLIRLDAAGSLACFLSYAGGVWCICWVTARETDGRERSTGVFHRLRAGER